jgi:hypothetical protein
MMVSGSRNVSAPDICVVWSHCKDIHMNQSYCVETMVAMYVHVRWLGDPYSALNELCHEAAHRLAVQNSTTTAWQHTSQPTYIRAYQAEPRSLL